MSKIVRKRKKKVALGYWQADIILLATCVFSIGKILYW